MMNIYFYTLLVAISLLSFGRNGNAHEENAEFPPRQSYSPKLYISEQGRVQSTQLNDISWLSEFENMEGHQFDTTMIVSQNDSEMNWGARLLLFSGANSFGMTKTSFLKLGNCTWILRNS